MDNSGRIPTEESKPLPRELDDLAQLIAELPAKHRHKLQAAYTGVAESFGRRRRILNLVQEALSQLRLDVKYLMFDLEVTKAERDELQAQLEEEI